MHFHVWNHMIPCVELHGRSVGHGSMHGFVQNHTDHMLPCMELHGSLMNLDPGSAATEMYEIFKQNLFSQRFRRKSTTLTVISLFSPVQCVRSTFLFICSTFNQKVDQDFS